MAVCSSTPSRTSSMDSESNEPNMNRADYLKSLPACMSLYFLHMTTLTSIAKRTTAKLYGPEAIQAPWQSTEFTIQSLMLEIDSWFMNLPSPYDFTSTQTSQCPLNQRVGLAMLFYSTKIAITRPCLCRSDGPLLQGDQGLDFCSKMAIECVESACHMLTLFPDTPEAALLYKVSPWWSTLHYLMQTTTVLLLELAFKGQHVPEKKSTISKAAKKALEWLSTLSKSSQASERAWKLCDGHLQRLAPRVECDEEFPPIKAQSSSDESTDVDAAAATGTNADNVAAELDSVTCSPMGQSSTPLAPSVSYGLEATEILDLMKPDKSLNGRSGYDEYLPYDPATGQITGSFFPADSNMNLDLNYLWTDPDMLSAANG